MTDSSLHRHERNGPLGNNWPYQLKLIKEVSYMRHILFKVSDQMQLQCVANTSTALKLLPTSL